MEIQSVSSSDVKKNSTPVGISFDISLAGFITARTSNASLKSYENTRHKVYTAMAIGNGNGGWKRNIEKYMYTSVALFFDFVDAPPMLLYSFIEQTLQPGPAVSLKCSAAGNPTPQVTWALDGFPLPTNGR